MSNHHTVEVTLCNGCLFDVGHDCQDRQCNTWQANARKRSRQAIRNMVSTATWIRQQSIQAGIKR